MDVTIKDVARAAGVSASTVSRVLTGNPKISPETQEKVRLVLRNLKYHPHAGARSLVTGSSRTIGLVTSRPGAETFANPFFPEVIRGICSVLEVAGYNLVLSTAQGEANQRKSCLDMLRSRHVDGVILTSSRLGDELIDALVSEGRNFVLIGRPADKAGNLSHPAVYAVNNDNILAAAVATAHLVSGGYRRIAFVTGPQHWVYCFDRLQGYRQGLSQAGLPLDPALVQQGNITQQDGNRALDRLFSLPEPPTAILAMDDTLALGALEAAQRRGPDPRIRPRRHGRPHAGRPSGRNPLPAAQVILPSEIIVRESTAGS